MYPRQIAISRLLICATCAVLHTVGGCATIRKLNPLRSSVTESRELTRHAESAMHMEEWEEAERQLLNAIERCPDDNHARSCLADVLWRRGANSAAIEQLNKSIQLSPTPDPVMLTKLGHMEFVEGHLGDALRHADTALDVDQSYANAWRLRGFVKKAQGEPQEALDSFFRSLSIQENDGETRMEIAKLYHAQARYERALATLDGSRADVHSPIAPEAHKLRGLVLRQLRRDLDSVDAFQDAYDNGLKDSELLFHLADAQLATGNLLQARASAEEARVAQGAAVPALVDLLRRIELADQSKTRIVR